MADQSSLLDDFDDSPLTLTNASTSKTASHSESQSPLPGRLEFPTKSAEESSRQLAQAPARLETASLDSNEAHDNAGKSIQDNGGRTFTLFPRLPPELRRKIWKHACYIPRVITLWAIPINTPVINAMDGLTYIETFQWKSHTRAPALLHSTSEARAVGHEHYSLTFDSQVNGEDPCGQGIKITITTPAKIYVNWDCDIICPFNPLVKSKGLLSNGAAIIQDFYKKPIKNLALSTIHALQLVLDRWLPYPKLEEIWIYPLLSSKGWRMPYMQIIDFKANDPFTLDFVPLENYEDLKQLCAKQCFASQDLALRMMKGYIQAEIFIKGQKQHLAVKHKIMRRERL